jgi:hypothetical protein
MLLPGDHFDEQIDEELEKADIILFLVSAEFLKSDYCYEVEVQRAVERHERGNARVIPVILRPCDWRNAPFGKLVAIPRDGRPVTLWRNRDEAYLDIATELRRVVEEWKRSKSLDLPFAPSSANNILGQPNQGTVLATVSANVTAHPRCRRSMAWAGNPHR